MSRIRILAAATLVGLALAQPAPAQDRPPPGCRWQSGDGGQILACKDAKGYWRRSGDDEIVGYDPPRVKPKPKPAVMPAPAATPGPAPAPSAPIAAAPTPGPAPVETMASAPTSGALEAADAAVPAAATAEPPPAAPAPQAPPAKPGFFAALWAKIVAWWEGLKAYFASQF